jgi:hypothetical protein
MRNKLAAFTLLSIPLMLLVAQYVYRNNYFPLSSKISVSPAQAQTGGTTYYISPTSPPGNDQNNGLSEATPLATFNRAWELLYPGDTLILLDGVYRQTLKPGKRNGTADAPITIRAKNDGKAIIDGEGVRIPVDIGDTWTGESGQNPVGRYFVVEGIVAKDSSGSVYKIVNGDNNIFRRVSGYNANKDGNDHVFTVWSYNNVLEDCVAAGTGRKMILSYRKGNNTIRRCYAQWEMWEGANFCPGPWPWGEQIETYNSSNNIIENSIAVGRSTNGINSFAQGGATSSNNQILGSISIRTGMNRDGSQIYWECPSPYNPNCPYCTDFKGNGGLRQGFNMGNADGSIVTNNVWKDVFAWGNGGLGFHANISTPSGSNNQLIRATMANNGLGDPIYSEIKGKSMRDKDLAEFEVLQDNKIEGTTHQGQGARVEYRYVDGVLTSEPLWPWPMEDRIRTEFAEILGINDYSVTKTIYPILAQYGAVPITGSADLNNDNLVNATDAAILFNNWFNPATSSADIYSDNKVNGIDFSYLKRDWTGN